MKTAANIRINSKPSPRMASTATLPPTCDDRDLVSFFDVPSSGATSPGPATGIFGHPSLTSPQALESIADAILQRAQLLTERVLRAPQSRSEMFKVVKNLDRLSDLLCSVVDLAEFVRNAHPDPKWVASANNLYESLSEFMNVLNTHVGLYNVLKAVLADQELFNALSKEGQETALVFWRDFEKCAIDLPDAQRNRFVSLSTEILVLGRQFMNDELRVRPPAVIRAEELDGLKDRGMGIRLKNQAFWTRRDLQVYPGSPQAQMIMRSAPNEEPRRKVYLASNSSTQEELYLLEQLLKTRAELARLVGSRSFAHMELIGKMAKSPENVRHFLDALMARNRPNAARALLKLSLRKREHLNTTLNPVIQPWDRDYYCPPEPPAPPIPLPPLTLGTVFMGLSRLFKHLYGVTLRPASVTLGQVWHPDVRKLEVVDEDNEVLGFIYADLFDRRGKPGGAAHYTVSCSRRVDDDDEPGDYPSAEAWDDPRLSFSREFGSIHRLRRRGRAGVYQIPVVALLCDFAPRSSTTGPTTLEWFQVLTLAHEMGHAMHSMFGQTEYHSVSGTRCATDFVELPSILMETFLTSSRVLSLFDIDGKLGFGHKSNHDEDPCHFIDTHSQILLAELDQIYHSEAVLSPSFDSTQALAKLFDSQSLIPYVPGTSWQTRFGHLYPYGATYYSYLFDRTIASRVWSKLFTGNPLSRETGERFKGEVLSYGGGKDPWLMLSSLLNAPELESGDARVMQEIGNWKLENEGAIPNRY